jgi:hypothetical protein
MVSHKGHYSIHLVALEIRRAQMKITTKVFQKGCYSFDLLALEINRAQTKIISNSN